METPDSIKKDFESKPDFEKDFKLNKSGNEYQREGSSDYTIIRGSTATLFDKEGRLNDYKTEKVKDNPKISCSGCDHDNN